MLKKIARSINPASLDLYGTKPTILVQGESISYSGVGIFSSFLVFGFVIWAAYINAAELFQKKSPTLTTANLPSSTINEPIELTPDIFDFSFGMVNLGDSTFYIDSSIYTVQALFYPDASDKNNKVVLDIEECQPSYLKHTTKIKGTLYCLKRTQSQIESINVLTKQDAYVSINFFKCQANCHPLIDDILKISFCGRLYSDWKIDPFNYKNPLQRYYKADWNGIVLDQTKATYLYLTRTEFTSDNGWLTSSTKTEKIVSVEKIETDSGDVAYGGVLYRLLIATSGNKNVYFRSYIKIQDVLAQTGSLCSGFIFLLGILVYPYSNLKMYEGLVNKAFHVKTNSPDAPEATSPLEYGDDLSVNRKLESSTNRINDLTYMDQSRIDDTNRNSHRRLDENADASELKAYDLTIQNITQDKIDYIPEFPAQTREIELQQRRLQPHIARGTQDNLPSLRETINNAVEIPGMDNNILPKKILADVEVNEKPNEQSITGSNQQVGETRRLFGCFRSRKKSRVTPASTNKRQSPLRIGYFEFLLSFFRKKPKIEAIEKGSKQIMLKLDFLLLFRKLNEIDRLKMCLMTRDQQLLFNSIQRPILDIPAQGKRKKKQQDEEEESKSDEESWPDLSELREAYLNLKRTGCRTTLDRNLVHGYEKNRDAIEMMARR